MHAKGKDKAEKKEKATVTVMTKKFNAATVLKRFKTVAFDCDKKNNAVYALFL